MNWTEEQEKILLEAAEYVINVGGKWPVVNHVVRQKCDNMSISEESCKKHFFEIIKKRSPTPQASVPNPTQGEVAKKTSETEEITYHVLDPDGLEDRVRELEQEVSSLQEKMEELQTIASTMHSLNESFKVLFAGSV